MLAYRLLVLSEAELVQLHVAVEQTAQQAREHRALRDAVLLTKQAWADLDEIGGNVFTKQRHDFVAVGAKVDDLE